MYDIISNIIDHSWITQGGNDQQYIYYVCTVLICVLVAVFVDLIYRLFTALWRK